MTNDYGQVDGVKPAKGRLGYTVGGEYSVSVAQNDALVYVRFDDGSFAQVYHRGRVAPIPDLPVEVGFDGAGNLVILGGDPARPGAVAGAYEVGLHSHARGSGMEFPVDARLLTPVRASPDGGLIVRVEQGAYWYGGSLRWWSGGSIALTPPASANQWAWIAVGIDAAAGSLVSATGTAVSIAAPLEPSTLPAIALAGAIPLAAVRVAHGQTELDEAEFEDLRFPIGGRAAGYGADPRRKTSGTHGGTFTSGAWQTRTLNVKAVDTNGVRHAERQPDHAGGGDVSPAGERARLRGRRTSNPLAERQRQRNCRRRHGRAGVGRADPQLDRGALHDQRQQDVRASASRLRLTFQRRLRRGGGVRDGSLQRG